MNGHCGCVELVEYIPFDYLYVVFAVGIKKFHFFGVVRQARATRPMIHLPRYRTHATVYDPLLFQTLKLSTIPVPPPLCRAPHERGERERERKRREGKSGFVVVGSRRSSPNTARLDARRKGNHIGTAIGAVVIAFAFVVLKGKP
jgi:hypothetical protein